MENQEYTSEDVLNSTAVTGEEVDTEITATSLVVKYADGTEKVVSEKFLVIHIENDNGLKYDTAIDVNAADEVSLAKLVRGAMCYIDQVVDCER